MKVGDTVKVIHNIFRSGEVGVVVRADVWNDNLGVDVHLVRIGKRDLWFTSYELEVQDTDQAK